MRRVWLHEVGVFEIIPNSGKGSCLFQAISQALTFSPKSHFQIRTITVDHMVAGKWAHKLNQLPEFWKHRIITQWLRKERSHLMRRASKCNPLHTNATKRSFCLASCVRCIQKFIEKRRERRYRKIKELYHNNRRHDCKEFKFIFRKFMSNEREPGTRFELEAAASRFCFHFDYLQMISPPREISKEDAVNNNAIFNKQDFTKCNENGIDTFEADNAASNKFLNLKQDTPNSLPEDDRSESIRLVTVKMGLYQFHSCRNNNCDVPKYVPYDHYYFLHSPIQDSGQVGADGSPLPFKHSSDQTNQCGHWELLVPISLRRYPPPLNRRIFGVTYELKDEDRNFSTRVGGPKREKADNVAEAIDAYIVQNPDLIPPEDPDWPADDEDDYSGCAAWLKNAYYDERDYVNSNLNIFKEDLNAKMHWGNVDIVFRKRFFVKSLLEKWKSRIVSMVRTKSTFPPTDSENDEGQLLKAG